jgi:hypothetical protein
MLAIDNYTLFKYEDVINNVDFKFGYYHLYQIWHIYDSIEINDEKDRYMYQGIVYIKSPEMLKIIRIGFEEYPEKWEKDMKRYGHSLEYFLYGPIVKPF